jgi:hypothetical protein
MVGFERPSAELAAVNERRAQYHLSQILRQHLTSYELIMAKSDPHGWYGPLLKLRRMADRLESGKWPAGSDGLNWFWSLPWGTEQSADRDLWLFWAKNEGSPGDSGGDADVVPLVPRGGLQKELVA